MARYTAGSYGNDPRRIYIYAISAVIVFYFILAFIFSFFPFGKSDENPAAESVDYTEAARSVVEGNVTEPQETVTESSAVEQTLPAAPQFAQALIEDSADSNSQASILISQANEALSEVPPQIIRARNLLNDALREAMTSQQATFVKAKLSELADQWLFGRQVFADDHLCGFYKVKFGDMLSDIGELYKVPWQILLDINHIKSERELQANQKIKVINGPFHAKIHRSAFTLDLYLQNTFVRSFKVGLGKSGFETPTGLWFVAVGGKLVSPPWTDPDTGKRYEAEDPNYPLGQRWIGIEGIKGDCLGRTGFAIHGTKNTREIGAAVSRGCIRLANEDVVLMYNLLMPGFSQVQVVD